MAVIPGYIYIITFACTAVCFLCYMYVHMCVCLCVCLSSLLASCGARILERRLPRRSNNKDVAIVTIFQFWSYLEVEGIKDLNTHVSELAEEGGWKPLICTRTHVHVKTHIINAIISSPRHQVHTL